MVEKLTVNLLTPDTVVLQKEAEMILVPGDDGEIGILPEHIALVTRLKPGVVKIYNAGKVEDKIFISGGFAKVHQNQLNILVESYNNIEDLNAELTQKEISHFEEELMTSENEDFLNSTFKEIALRRKIIETIQEYR
jgi:F-type H+-transporting ATPase subunit epsilon